MRIESSITSVSWIPEGSVSGLARVPFSLGVTHYDDRPRTRLGDLDALRADPNVREVNRLEAWIEVGDGRIIRSGYGRNSGFVGSTSLDLGVTRVTVPGRARPVLRRRPLVSAQTARFVQTIGGRTGMPFPRLTARPPYLAWNSSTAWTTLVLTLHADGRKDGWLLGASPFPRHFLYDDEGNLDGRHHGDGLWPVVLNPLWAGDAVGWIRPGAAHDPRVRAGTRTGGGLMDVVIGCYLRKSRVATAKSGELKML